MKKEYDFSKSSPRRKRDLPTLEERRRHTKVRITMMVDEDVLAYFKKKAEEPGSEPYQTQINRALRTVVAGGSSITGELLADDSFIAKVAERVHTYRGGHSEASPGRSKPARRGRAGRSTGES